MEREKKFFRKKRRMASGIFSWLLAFAIVVSSVSTAPGFVMTSLAAENEVGGGKTVYTSESDGVGGSDTAGDTDPNDSGTDDDAAAGGSENSGADDGTASGGSGTGTNDGTVSDEAVQMTVHLRTTAAQVQAVKRRMKITARVSGMIRLQMILVTQMMT